MPSNWWRDAVVYEVYVRSFADSDGDGVGDLPGIRRRLPYVAGLGVDAIWLTPFYPSPMHDAGYDVADYCGVDAGFGTLADFDRLLSDAHALDLRVFVDVVPNHTSVEHPWFRAAIADERSPERGRYIFRAGKADGSPPNDWQSVFGGSAWTRDEASGEFYLHLFDSSQPDLNWRDPVVHERFRDILRFWLDRGVDGFRIDVAHALMKDAQLRDGSEHAWDQDEVFAVWEEWRRLLDDYADGSFVGEVFVYDMPRVAEYVGPSRLHQAFNFSIAKMPFDVEAFRAGVRRSLALFEREGTSPTWVLSNHDLVRHVTRYGVGEAGRQRALAATALLLALPGSPYLFQGEELGLEQSDVAPDARRDPIWSRSGKVGRDGCRTPMPWSASPPGHGFTTGTPWLPFDEQANRLAVDRQDGVEGSTLETYRALLAARRSLLPTLSRQVDWVEAPDGCLAFSRSATGGGGLLVATNFTDEPRVLVVRGAGRVLATTDPAVKLGAAEHLEIPARSTTWLSRADG